MLIHEDMSKICFLHILRYVMSSFKLINVFSTISAFMARIMICHISKLNNIDDNKFAQSNYCTMSYNMKIVAMLQMQHIDSTKVVF